MLSRTADDLYWIARYTERAENLARMLDVTYRMSLLPQAQDSIEQGWTATLAIIGVLELYRERYDKVTPGDALTFLAFDRLNPSSIYSCLQAARENARAVRGTLTSEIWETFNSTWLEMRTLAAKSVPEAETSNFFEWVKFRSHLARGVVQGTMLRDEAYHFSWLGTYLERADNTARILDVKYSLLEEHTSEGEDALDYYQWSALLHSVSAFEIYRRVYRDAITPRRVVELLILRDDMPRSLHRCMSQVYTHLQAIRNDRSAETERRAGELFASLRFGRTEDVFEEGIHNYLLEFLERTCDLGERVAQDFLVSTTKD